MAVGGPDDDGAPSSSRDPPPQASEGGERTQQRAWFATHVRPAFVEPQRHARFGQSADDVNGCGASAAQLTRCCAHRRRSGARPAGSRRLLRHCLRARPRRV